MVRRLRHQVRQRTGYDSELDADPDRSDTRDRADTFGGC